MNRKCIVVSTKAAGSVQTKRRNGFFKVGHLGRKKEEKIFSFENCEENGENVLHTLKWD